MILPQNVRLESHPTARNQTVAATQLSKGSTIAAFTSLSNILLFSEKGHRCDRCFRTSSKQRKLRKCTGCTSYWYCDTQCQSVQWEEHHRKFCRSYRRFTMSNAFQSLPLHEQLDALLLAHLMAQLQATDTSNEHSPISVFLSLLPGHMAGDLCVPIPDFKPAPSPETAKDLYSRFSNNNFAIHSHLTTVGHGIFPLASRLFNHSCYPNAAAKYLFTSTGVVMEVVALRDILLDEEICIPYLDPAMAQTRQQIFKFTYGFQCTCPSCQQLEHIGDILPPSPSEAPSVAQTLREFVGLSKPITTMPSKPRELVPHSLFCVFHETYLSSLSEIFSKSAHEGNYGLAIDTGLTLLGAYILIYPPNYPQIGMHLLELAKTSWNSLVRITERNTNTIRTTTEQTQHFLNLARDILVIYGAEGDEGGPLLEVSTLQSLLNP